MQGEMGASVPHIAVNVVFESKSLGNKFFKGREKKRIRGRGGGWGIERVFSMELCVHVWRWWRLDEFENRYKSCRQIISNLGSKFLGLFMASAFRCFFSKCRLFDFF